MRKIYSLIAAVLFCGSVVATETATVTFEDIELGENVYDNGSSGNAKFTSCGFDFVNTYDAAYGSWSGFSISSSTSTAFEMDNYAVDQYNSCVGVGAGSSSKYAVGYYDPYNVVAPISIKNSDAKLFTPQSVAIANSAFTFNIIRTGNNFSKKFTEEDFYTVTFIGYKSGSATGTTVSVDMAKDGMMIYAWKTIDLSALGEVDEIRFSAVSSDNGEYGCNTPAYFCIDDFVAEVSSETAVKATEAVVSEAKAVAVFTVDGKQLTECQPGINIIKMSDGTVRKYYK